MDWSIDGQTPEFLAATRLISLADPIVRTILADVPLEPGMRVLDVGCGSGEYCFRLGSAVEGVQFVGLEYDARFVEFANERARGEVGYPFEQPNPANSYQFVCGDGLDLPFDDGAFDAVVSHTYLTALPDWAAALAEMCRVCKPGGIVSSVTSLTDDFYGTGTIELFSGLLAGPDAAVVARVAAARRSLFHDMALAPGIAPRKAPVAFAWIGLERVHCTPLAHYFCLSDADTDADDYVRYVDLLCAMERKQLARLVMATERPASTGEVGKQPAPIPHGLLPGDLERYAELIEERRDFLIGSMGANREWDWYGNASLLVSGRMPESGASERCSELRAANQAVRAVIESCKAVGLQASAQTTQLGPGRCVKTVLESPEGHSATVFGFDPPSALAEGYAKLLAQSPAYADMQASPTLAANQNSKAHEATFALAREEMRYEQLEHEIRASIGASNLPECPPESVFESSAMWETVSEAALGGLSTSFKNVTAHLADNAAGMHAIVCLLQSDTGTSEGVSVHAEFHTAAQRAFARACGNLG